MKRISDPERKADIIAKHHLREVLSDPLIGAFSLQAFEKGEYIFYSADFVIDQH